MRYMIESERTGTMSAPRYEDIGVWVHAGNDLLIRYLPGHAEQQREAAAILRRLPDELKPDLLEYWRDALPAHRGLRSDPVETDEYESAAACVREVLMQISETE